MCEPSGWDWAIPLISLVPAGVTAWATVQMCKVSEKSASIAEESKEIAKSNRDIAKTMAKNEELFSSAMLRAECTKERYRQYPKVKLIPHGFVNMGPSIEIIFSWCNADPEIIVDQFKGDSCSSFTNVVRESEQAILVKRATTLKVEALILCEGMFWVISSNEDDSVTTYIATPELFREIQEEKLYLATQAWYYSIIGLVGKEAVKHWPVRDRAYLNSLTKYLREEVLPKREKEYPTKDKYIEEFLKLARETEGSN